MLGNATYKFKLLALPFNIFSLYLTIQQFTICDLMVYVRAYNCVIQIVTTLNLYCANYVEYNSIQSKKTGRNLSNSRPRYRRLDEGDRTLDTFFNQIDNMYVCMSIIAKNVRIFQV